MNIQGNFQQSHSIACHLKECCKFISTQVGGHQQQGKQCTRKSKMPASQLLLCCCVNLKSKGLCHHELQGNNLHQRASQDWGNSLQQAHGNCLNWDPNKLQMLLLRRRSKENPTSSKVVNSFWMGHIVGTTCLTTTNFCNVPPMQRLKSFGQNQCLWCLNDLL